MKSITFNSAKILSLALSFLLCSAYSYAENEKKKTPLESGAEIAAKCPEVLKLLSVIGSKKIFSQTPEEFTQSVSGMLKINGEKTVDAGTHQLREITFGEEKNKWLASAQGTYRVRDKKVNFDRANFEFPPSCFGAPEDFMKLSKRQFGGKFLDRSYAPPEKILEWEFPDVDIDNIRTIQIAASKQRYEIKVAVDPASSEP